jgi:hypothetical protein
MSTDDDVTAALGFGTALDDFISGPFQRASSRATAKGITVRPYSELPKVRRRGLDDGTRLRRGMGCGQRV